MKDAKILKAATKGKNLEPTMLVETVHGSKTITLYGLDGVGCIIPLEQVENFIQRIKDTIKGELKICEVPFNDEGDAIRIWGASIQKIENYLRQARDIGVKLAGYKMIFI
jgi:hypothetical protein